MFCPNCGVQNPDEVRFCSNCGTSFASNANPTVQPAPAPQPAPSFAPAPQTAQPPVVPVMPVIEIPQKKNNVLCSIGFLGSLISISLLGTTSIVFLIISVIGLFSAKKKDEKGRGYAIAGIIISSVFVLTAIIGIIIGLWKRNNL